MQISDIRNPNERNKLILAGALGLVAVVFLWWTFFGFGSSSTKVTPRAAGQPTPSGPRRTTPAPAQTAAELPAATLSEMQVVNSDYPVVVVPEARRNIFAYYEPPPKVVEAPSVPAPTPTPTPPVLLASISPGNVYAGTGNFTLEVSGDKFSPQLRVVIDNNEFPTRYINPQQLSAPIPASVIQTSGTRQVMVRSADGKLYSNTTTLSIAEPPKPNYSYIGIIGKQRFVGDTAILLDKGNKDTLNVQRGDLIGGKFRVLSISEKEVVVIDNNLKIKHTLAMTSQGDRGNPLQRPTPRVESEDDEP
ncbi:MAG TPA: IPT/TIG domain-containing protein [Pyrinomonadaceae bacterium]